MKISSYGAGVLVEEGGAYSLLHPWPKLGDNFLEAHLLDLKSARRLPLTQRCLQILEIEKAAKLLKERLTTPGLLPTHYFLELDESLPENYEIFKLKIGSDSERELAYLKKINDQPRPFRLRLDCNLKFDREQAMKFFERLPDTLLCRIDFVEDPLKGSERDWEDFVKNFDLRVAHDFAPTSFRDVAAVWILKPSRHDPWPLVERATHEMKRVVVTSALDHVLGFSIAAWEAARILEKHPLLVDTSGIYFGPKFPRPDYAGFGFGMDHEMSKLKWKELV